VTLRQRPADKTAKSPAVILNRGHDAAQAQGVGSPNRACHAGRFGPHDLRRQRTCRSGNRRSSTRRSSTGRRGCFQRSSVRAAANGRFARARAKASPRVGGHRRCGSFRRPVPADKEPTLLGILSGFGGNDSSIAQEDCLYLNVWTPEWPVRKRMPVMVWIQGGGNFPGVGEFMMERSTSAMAKSRLARSGGSQRQL
jgi:hypothetical protein